MQSKVQIIWGEHNGIDQLDASHLENPRQCQVEDRVTRSSEYVNNNKVGFPVTVSVSFSILVSASMMGWKREMLFSSPLVVIASSARSCPSGGTKQIPAMSLTASTITAGKDGTKERARSVNASRCSNSFFRPTLLLEMAFKHLMHSCWTLSHLASLQYAIKKKTRSIKTVNETNRHWNPPSVAFVENIQNLIQSLANKIVDPSKWIIGQGDPQRFHTAINFMDTQIRVAQICDVILRGIESVAVFLRNTRKSHWVSDTRKLAKKKGYDIAYLNSPLHMHGEHFFFTKVRLQSQWFFFFLGEVHVILLTSKRRHQLEMMIR